MENVSKEDFVDLVVVVQSLQTAVQSISDNMRQANADHALWLQGTWEGQRLKDEWILSWHGQYKAHVHAFCAISATLGLLLSEAGVSFSSIEDSIEQAKNVIAPELRVEADHIFDSVLNAIRDAKSLSNAS